jgi:hypothetical protein
MNALLNRLITNATAPIGKISARLFKQATLFFVAMSCLFVSSIFFTIALFMFVQSLARTAIAAFSAGGLYLGSLSFASPLRRARGRTMPHLPRRSLAHDRN